MTQAQLDLARLGMTIARMQFAAMAAVNEAVNVDGVGVASYRAYEQDMAELCELICNGKIRGSDAGRG